MSAHWRLALWYVAWVSVGAAMVGAAIWFLYGEVYTEAFLYGVSLGIASLISMALVVSLLAVHANVFRMMIGAVLFVARYGFLAVMLGIPAYLNPWPVLPMIFGCAGVYLAENLLLLPGVLIVVKPGRSVHERVERRVEA